MAVNVLAPMQHGYSLVALCGVNKELMDKAMVAGIQITHSATGTLSIKSKNGYKTYGIVPFKGSAVSLLKEGKLGPASKESVKYQVEKSIKVALEDWDTFSMPEAVSEVVGGLTTDDEEQCLIPKKVVEVKPKMKVSSTPEADSIFAIQKKKKKVNMQQVELVNAENLYQPVFGTSNGSVYYVTAIFKDLKLAVRKQAMSLSIRAEGDLEKYLSGLDSVGFSIKSGHASVHLEVQDDDLYLKTMGAVIGALGFNNLVEVGNPLEAKA